MHAFGLPRQDNTGGFFARGQGVVHCLLVDTGDGLPDFPTAAVHLYAGELEACLYPQTLMERWAYLPEHRAHGPRWQPHLLQGDQWFGLDCTPPVRVGEAEFTMVPFTGHTRGHCGVAVRMDDRWVLHCGDAYGYYGQADPVQPYTHPSGRLIEFLVTAGFKMPRRHWGRIRKLRQAHNDEIQAFCAHDAHEFELARASLAASP
jgi:glyoxylase-like metal-dependent hydrolase (beta-lactamase superfamily II)